jgi:hypothetical protein
MKLWYRLLFLSILILALTGCDKDSSDEELEESSEAYHSKDMTEDGKVTQLQKHTIGKGIPIIIMCDKFLDKDIVSGKYREATNWALEGLFSVHPMRALKDYFDVYEVTAVSYAYSSSKTTSTAFSARSEKSYRGGDDNKAVRYAKKAIDEERIDDAVIIILINYNQYFRSFCSYVNMPSSYSGIPTGCAVAYVQLPLNENGTIIRDGYPGTLLHETVGHGFAKLADEYVEEERKWKDPESEMDDLLMMQNRGYYRNVSLESDVTKSPWADFAADSRYDFEKLGCYEGGYYQEKGVYRPTENSLMRHSDMTLYFNVISRAMFYKRCMNIAFGDSWQFNYEDFVKFDLEKAKAAYQADKEQYPYNYSASKRFCAPPQFVKMKVSR